MGRGNTARRITIPAMMVALSVVLLMVSGFFDTAKVGTLVLISFIPAILVAESSWTSAVAAYGATLACGLIFLPDKMLPLAYGLFFGCYGFLWYAMARVRQGWLRLLLSLVIFNAVWLAGLFLVRGIWPGMPFIWVYLAGQPAFVAYYYLYNFALRYYFLHGSERLRKVLGVRG